MTSKIIKANQNGKIFLDLVKPIFDSYFCSDYNLVDIGAGNGCCGLFWPNFVYFVDRRKPNTFDDILQVNPKTNFKYCETDFVDFDTRSVEGKTSFVGIHTCRNLADLIIDRAISERTPLAIIPCCHPSLNEYIHDDSVQNLFSGNCAVYIDRIRQKKLLENNFEVYYRIIESINPPKNRIIIGLPK